MLNLIKFVNNIIYQWWITLWSILKVKMDNLQCNLINNVNINSKIVLPSHPYHIVDQSPWPIALSGVLLSLTTYNYRS